MNFTSSCPSQLSETIKTTLQTKLTNKIEVGDAIRVIDAAVKVQYEAERMPTVMLHTIMDPTA